MKRLGKSERRERILAELKLAPHVRISELADRFGVSTETVRRDVDQMSRQGLVSRAYGGAASPMGVQPPFGERNQARLAERARIAELAASLVQPGEVLMVDAGSTTNQFARRLAVAGRDLTILTNSLAIATALSQNASIDVILCPGDLLPAEAAVYGDETIAFLQRHHANRCFIGAGGVDADGIMDVNRAATAVKRAMVRQSEKSHLLIDASKFNLRLISIVEPLAAIDALITDEAPSGPLADALAADAVEILVAGLRELAGHQIS